MKLTKEEQELVEYLRANFKKRADLENKTQVFTKHLREKYGKLFDYALPPSTNSKEKMEKIISFCEKNGYVPNQKSKNIEESKLGYLSSYYKKLNNEFCDKLKKYPTFSEYKLNQNKKEALNFIKNFITDNGFRPSNLVNHAYINKSNKLFDIEIYNTFLSAPNKIDYFTSKKAEKIRKKYFKNGFFISKNEEILNFVRKHPDYFPEYKKIEKYKKGLETLEKILLFCKAKNRQPSKIGNCANSCEENEYFLASNLSDYKKRMKKNGLIELQLNILKEILTFPTVDRCEKLKKSIARKTINLHTKIVYDSISDAAKSINKKPNTISAALSGKRKTAGGYRWAYCDENGNILE